MPCNDNNSAHIGVLYVLSRSLPDSLASMNLGPKAGTRYMAPRNAYKENPSEVYSAGTEGTGSKSGLTTNQLAMGTRPNSRAEGNGRGTNAFSDIVTGQSVAQGLIQDSFASKEWIEELRGG